MISIRIGVLCACWTSTAFAQWNPPLGLWGKDDPAQVRVLSWNVRDAICSTNAKVEGANNWSAVARIVASLQPDLVFLAETGDNVGNGTGTAEDSVADLATTVGLWLRGGLDPFHANSPVTAFVQKYAPNYDLPYVYVSSATDGFNRNIILSRFAVADLNGDGKSTQPDVPNVTATAWAPGGNGGIRGFAIAELALPHATYRGSLVFGGAHLKSGSTTSDHNARVVAAQNVSYVLRYEWNGNGGGIPDPQGAIADSPPATRVLDAFTPIVLAGDWNEDELANGSVRGPADWLTAAATVGGTGDGTDADGSDMTYDSAVDAFSGSRATIGSATKFDYVAWQDSLAVATVEAVFDSSTIPAAALPSELAGFTGGASSASSIASDHRPVLVDLELPIVDCNGNGVADTTDIARGTSLDLDGDHVPDECECPAAPTVYCTAKSNSLGCTPSISSVGFASATSTASFLIRAEHVLNLKPGLLFYGFAPFAAPFQGGTLCVQPPIVRLGVVSAGGSATGLDCTGNYSVDFNARIQAHVDPALVAGAQVDAQWWARDPFDAFSTSLTDALAFGICPR